MPSRSVRPRPARSFGGRLAVSVALLAVTVEVTWLVSDFGGAQVTQWFSDLSGIAAPACASLLCVLAARRANAAASETATSGAGWWALGAACGSWAAGQAVWSYYELALGREVPFPSAADLGFLGTYPFALAALLLFPLGAKRAVSAARVVLDGLIVGCSLLFATWALVIGPALADQTVSSVERTLGLLYPVGDVVLLTVAFTVSSRIADRRAASLRLVIVGIAALGVSDVLFTYFTTSGSYATGSLVDAGWFTGFALIAVASVRTRAAHQRAHDAPAANASLLIYFPTIFVIIGEAQPHLEPIVAMLGASVLVLVVARQVATTVENRGLTQDLHHRVQELRDRDEQFRLVLKATRDAVWDLDLATNTIAWGDGIRELFGYDPTDVSGSVSWWSAHVHPDDVERVLRSRQKALRHDGPSWTAEYRFLRSDGRWITVMDRGFLVRGSAGKAGRMVGAMMDISDRKRYEIELAHRALHDPLTDLPNRTLLVDHLRKAIDSGTADTLGLFFLDLDHFKRINDSYGHAVGDEVIVAVGRRLRRAVRDRDIVARFGGDEFVIVCDNVPTHEEARHVVDRILTALAAPHRIDGRVLHLSASIGVALARDVDLETNGFLQSADTALYEAKARGRARYAMFNEELSSRVRNELELTEALRIAIADNALTVHFQPMVELASRRPVGAEALARWTHDGSAIPPALFIRLAEEAGLVEQLGDWILDRSCREVAGWGLTDPDFVLSVNLSPLQLTERLPGQVRRTLDGSGLAPSQLWLEITESALMTNARAAMGVLEQLRRMGVRVALDDFGTGYSSLAYLNRLPVDVLKIDRSFVAGIAAPGEGSITEAIMGIARVAKMTVVAEGIEHEHQVDHLIALGCGRGQGHLFGPARPGSEIVPSFRACSQRDSAASAPNLT